MFKKILLVLFLIISTSCANLSFLKSKENELKESEDFYDILALKYLNYADILYQKNEYGEAKYFAKLGEKAVKKQKADLVKVSVSKDIFKYKSSIYLELQRLREVLEKLTYNDSIVKNFQNMLSDAHFYFNCWAFNENKSKDLSKATKCREEFLITSTSLIRASKFNRAEKESSEDTNLKLNQVEQYYFLEFLKNKTTSVYFDLNSFNLNPNGLIKISMFLKYLNSLEGENRYLLTVSGHADRTGKSIYNNRLSRKRALTIYNILVKNGVPRDSIRIDSYGSKYPKIITKKEELNQYNRRVDVTFRIINNSEEFSPLPL